ncbi:hypothetical protein F444_12029 [Phytophthora nicotianae P1976]|uniref:Uncharacterized protein n=1 Tax=Phytophthora nicotianae P1976 TaxID=1317066 RepID=A0A080ZYG5_PHYNI|nr:hypothetical protein F444_12029 [Phytophthora nicotianae P1976]
MDGVARAVERGIASEMPERCGLILDGWTHCSKHYVAVFACYELSGKSKTPLFSMTPLLNDEDDDLSAVAHREFLADMLPRDFGRQVHECVFLVGDNCSVNRRLAMLVGVGCASHQLNCAVQRELQEHENDLAAVQALMIKLRTLTQSAKLRTRDGAQRFRCFIALLEHLDDEDEDISDLLPAPACNRRLRSLLKELKKNVESISNLFRVQKLTYSMFVSGSTAWLPSSHNTLLISVGYLSTLCICVWKSN